ncbi:hypothetical protein SteCoe_19496 [Stentor coeruleus]|uniref:PPM-type phosphatase domain-containing protein n=1 Tax=Stentor coeruleus TaxID=5963 RepID=A0A1R2BUC2_9CILI|nr:hypothetical protein SteCoe_19496 [Stentor coeruleus]
MEKSSYKSGHFSSHKILKPIIKFTNHIQTRRHILNTLQLQSTSISPIKNSTQKSNKSLGKLQVSNISKNHLDSVEKVDRSHHVKSNRSKEKLSPIRMPVKNNMYESSRLVLCPVGNGFKKVVVGVLSKTVTGMVAGKTKKANQDSNFIMNNFMGSANQVFLGVMDGHGLYGGQVSNYVKNALPYHMSMLLNHDSNPSREVKTEEDFDRIKSAFIESYKQIHNEVKKKTDIDANFSGTTAISLLIQGKYCFCSNVGDSRAVIGRYTKSGWLAIPLSCDQKPDNPEERYRIEQAGGRIAPYTGIDGNPIGPYRVWLKNDSLPGLAMSRSIGDLIAGQVGVSHIPEVIVHEFDQSDKFIIIASDGIWEFISSEECVQMIALGFSSGKMQNALDGLTDAAVLRWKKQDGNVDDVTAIVVSLKVKEEGGSGL